MNAMNSLFDALPMPGSSKPPAETVLPSLAPASGWDDGWADSLAQAEAPAEEWAPAPEDEGQAPEPEDLAAVASSWEERQAETAALVARAQANAAAARARAAGQGESADLGAGRGSGTPGYAWGVTVADPTELVKGLNPAQEQAVTHAGAPLLIIAGAGSGKTRVLTHRIAYLLATGRARPGEILAITFTNKAAAEMRERVAGLVGPAGERMWVSTFHSACVRILRREHEAAGLRSTFSIYDSADSQRLITLIVKELGIDSKRFTPKTFANRISDLKNEPASPGKRYCR